MNTKDESIVVFGNDGLRILKKEYLFLVIGDGPETYTSFDGLLLEDWFLDEIHMRQLIQIIIVANKTLLTFV